MSSRFWHPFAKPETPEAERIVVVSGRGAMVVDDEGHEYFDATAGLWYCAVGHGRERIAAAISRQAATLASYSCFGGYATPSTLELADRIAALAPLDDPSVFLTSGGSDGVETAAKIVRRHFVLKGQPQRTAIISRDRAYHGTHTYGTALGGIASNHDGWGTLVSGVEQIPSFDAGALEETIQRIGPDRVAAFFVEPVIGAGGVFPPPDDYLSEVAAVCRANGVLLVCDEVVTGVGRTGHWSACDRYGVRPDLMILAKALTSGYQPLGAVIISGDVVAPFREGEGEVLRHGYTYSGHATACAAALENLDIVEEEGLIARVAELSERLPGLLGGLEGVEGVEEVRMIGLTAAIQLDADHLGTAGAGPPQVVAGCRERGQLTRLLAGGALHFSPPFVTSERQIERFAEAVEDTLSDLVGFGPPRGAELTRSAPPDFARKGDGPQPRFRSLGFPLLSENDRLAGGSPRDEANPAPSALSEPASSSRGRHPMR